MPSSKARNYFLGIFKVRIIQTLAPEVEYRHLKLFNSLKRNPNG